MKADRVTGETVGIGPVEVVIDGITSEGSGVGRLPDGRALFVPRTAPGDRARVEIRATHARWARGRLVAVPSPGPDRREAPCPFFEGCGGCTLQHLTYPAQLKAKAGIVESALRRIGGLDAFPEPVVHPSPRETRYRNRVTLVLRRDRSGRVTAGFHASEHPEAVVDVDGRCLLPEEPIARAWDELRAAWGPGAELLPEGKTLRLTLRANEKGEVLLLVAEGRGTGKPELLLERAPSLSALWIEGREGGRPKRVAGGPLLETWGGETLDLDPRAFLQANRGAAAALSAVVLRELGDVAGRRVLDLYCGFGFYGREAARRGAGGVGIESDASAAKMGRGLAAEGFQFVKGKVEECVRSALPADLVVLNPPRVGVAAGVMEALAESGADRIVYVSCDPATLARDLTRLGPGYRIRGIEVFDLFPQTAHVETVVTLVRS